MDLELSLSKSDLSEAFVRLQQTLNDTYASKLVWPSGLVPGSDLDTSLPIDAIALKVKEDDAVSLTLSVSSDVNDNDMVTIHCRGSIDSLDFSSSAVHYEGVTRNLSSAFAAVLLDLGLTSDEQLTSMRLISFN